MVVFRGEPASAEVVAGFLRSAGVSMVEVTPASIPYPAGPMRQSMVRVPDEQQHAHDLLRTARLDRRLTSTFSLRMRFMAWFVLMSSLVSGF